MIPERCAGVFGVPDAKIRELVDRKRDMNADNDDYSGFLFSKR